MKKNSFLIIIVILSLFVFVSCDSSDPSEVDGTTDSDAGAQEMIGEDKEEESMSSETDGIYEGDSETEEMTGEDTEEKSMAGEISEGSLELTLEELSEFNGKDGKRAYVAVDGTIYDVTDVEAWQNGMHNGVEAGNDLTDEIMNQSPHGTSTLSKAEIVGKLVE